MTVSRDKASYERELARFQDTNNRIGIWDGKVVSIDDPTRTGLVRVRVFLIHGDETETPDHGCPWAEVNYWGGGYDWGEYDPPTVGTKVHVIFKMGHEDFPVVVGAIRGHPEESQKMRSAVQLPESSEEQTEEQVLTVEPSWDTPAGELETPKDIFETKDGADDHPTRSTWRKSFKGHTILVEDGDGMEFLKIIDRAGQVIELSCPVSTELNSTIDGQRGLALATEDTQLNQEDMVDVRGFIRLKDVAGQEVILDGRQGNERIYIHNRNRASSREQSIELYNKRGEEYINIVDQAGNQIRLASNEDLSIKLLDKRGSYIGFDSNTGNIVLAPKVGVVQQVGGDQTVTLEGSDNKSVDGDRIIEVVNNLAVSAGNVASFGSLGNTNVNIGGAANVVLGGSSLTTMLPLDTALNFSALNGDISLTAVGTLSGGNIIFQASHINGGNINVFAGLLGKVYLGRSESSENAILGATFKDHYTEHIHPTGTGPSGKLTAGTPFPEDDFLSTIVFVE